MSFVQFLGALCCWLSYFTVDLSEYRMRFTSYRRLCLVTRLLLTIVLLVIFVVEGFIVLFLM